MNPLPPSSPWAAALQQEFDKPYFAALMKFIAGERQRGPVYPPEDQVWTAFLLTPLPRVKVLVLGQDPYHGPGQAHGLAFSVTPGVAPPPSLANIFKELVADVGGEAPQGGSLVPWAQQGVMLLNAVLTVRGGESASHQGQGWEKFTDAVIQVLNARPEPLVFVLWGGYARKKARLIDRQRHRVLEGTHPSPLSAHQGFFGSKPFSTINKLLGELGQAPIDWSLRPGAAQAPSPPSSSAPARRPRPTPARHPAVLALAEALQARRTPSPRDLAAALTLSTWDALTAGERATTAQAVAGVLPRGFTLDGLQSCASGTTHHEVAFYTGRGVRFALVPGGDLRLGWHGNPLHIDDEVRWGWEWAWRRAGRKEGAPATPEAWIAPWLTPPRQARIAPFLIEVQAPGTGAEALKGWREKDGLSAHEHLVAALAGAALRLPSSDEWEHACAAGERALFRWGEAWAAGRPRDDRPQEAPNALGLRLPTAADDIEATDDPDVFRGGGLGGTEWYEAEARFASSFVLDLRRQGREEAWLEHLRRARVRRARSIFPYAKR